MSPNLRPMPPVVTVAGAGFIGGSVRFYPVTGLLALNWPRSAIQLDHDGAVALAKALLAYAAGEAVE